VKVHRIKGFIQNIYLVEYPDKCMLLDGCSRADFTTVQRFFEDTLKRPLRDLRIVVVTHMHPDHAGCAHYFRAATGCKIVSANKTSQWYQGIQGRLSHLMDIGLAYWVANKMKRPKRNIWYSPYLQADYHVNDGDSIPEFDEWCAFETPGHTDRDLSVMHMPSKRIYVADLIVRVKRELSPPFPVHIPHLYKASLKRLASLKPNSVLMAHAEEVSLTSGDYESLLNKAPNTPETNQMAIKQMLKGAFSRKKLNLRNKS
jgi:glyoxylase-like metal-dependent hydrolase (beta-lactamase superfamily II)